MSKLLETEFLNCVSCGFEMANPLFCKGKFYHKNRCRDIVCENCEYCRGCEDRIDEYKKLMKRNKRYPEQFEKCRIELFERLGVLIEPEKNKEERKMMEKLAQTFF